MVIPTKDRWGLLARSLGCVLRQEDVDLEAVVLDDGSAQGPPQDLAALRDPRVRLLRHERSTGVARARNDAIAQCRGTWIAFLDDDDLWAPGKLAAQLEAARDSGGGLSYTGTVWLNDAGQAIVIHAPPAPGTLAADMRGHNVIGGPSAVMARAESVRAAGGFDERFAVLADWDLWLRLLRSEAPAPTPGPLTGYVVHEGSMHGTAMDEVPREFALLAREHAVPGERFGNREYRVWRASTYRRTGRTLKAARSLAVVGWYDRDPRQLARAATLVFGERAMRAMRGGRDGAKPSPPPTPAWVHGAFAAG